MGFLDNSNKVGETGIFNEKGNTGGAATLKKKSDVVLFPNVPCIE